ncbi:MAG: dUTP diphosphatase [Ruminococcaceae bacterium]|nr:dUTP diphosphatase [Oscillospiraceae bacterium]
MQILKVKKLKENAKMIKRATKGSAGMDLHACIDVPVTINPGEIKVIPTGLAIALENENYVAYIYARSGLAIKHGITLANCVGVVDSDYRGEVCVGLTNISKEAYTIEQDERIAQLVIAPVCTCEAVEVDELDDTSRGAGGFGSTGKQ